MTTETKAGESVRHSVLVAEAAKWLRRKCSIIVTEMGTTGEEPDVIGWHGTHSILVECKASIADFKADQHKFFRRNPEMGIGQYRYYMTPPALLQPDMLPTKWGLLEVGKTIREVKAAEYCEEVNLRHELGILISTIRRIGQSAPKGISIRCYTFDTQNTATLGLSNTKAGEL